MTEKKKVNFLQAVGLGMKTVGKKIQEYEKNAPQRRKAQMKIIKEDTLRIRLETERLKALREKEKYMGKQKDIFDGFL